ncbi:MAG: 50S ribosomal protein L17 [Patescibacteria group bacterium]
MRHRNSGKVFSREIGPRTAFLKGLTLDVVLYEKVQTTEARAKAIKPMVEKLVTRGKEATLHNRRELLRFFGQQELPVKKILEVLSPRYKTRAGGYTRIIKMGPRKGDGAQMVQIEFV